LSLLSQKALIVTQTSDAAPVNNRDRSSSEQEVQEILAAKGGATAGTQTEREELLKNLPV
jgi:hypothetical protein